MHRPLLILALLVVPTFVSAAEPAAPVNVRFQAAEGDEVPDFQRHVVPLLGRLGCNGRACHGSFQGQGGFRLSLFGYDFEADHAALVGGDEPRATPKNPGASAILRKPTLEDDHRGGKRMALDSWEYRLLRRWIAAGAPARPENAALFETLIVEPKEIVLGKPGETIPLRVTAKWADGTVEDVTPLCRFRTNDESVAEVSDSGVVTALGPGDTAIVALYDNGTAPVPVLIPVSDRLGPNYPAVPTPTKVDELVVAKHRKLGIVPSERNSDTEFLRRLRLDLTGTIPSPEEVRSFLADSSKDKRTKKIEELLASPEYAAWWATKLSDFTGNAEATGPLGGESALNRAKSEQWYEWIRRRIAENRPYDELVAGILLATGRSPGQEYTAYCEEMSAYFRKDDPADFTARSTMPYFWTRRSVGSAENKALAVAHAFLGLQLQCAQCHKHPYDQWTKQDFDQFTAFFNGVRYGGGDRKIASEMKKGTPLDGMDEDNGNYKRKFVELLGTGKVLPFKDLSVPANLAAKNKTRSRKAVSGRVITPKLLGGDEVVDRDYPDARQPVLDWMRESDNPYFATAFVNRVWAAYFGVGIVDPPDDLNLANPPSNPALLQFLADGFVKSGYDMKWLHRTIATSRTYQLTWRPTETNQNDERNFSHALLRRLPAEVAYDAVMLATAGDEERKKFATDPSGMRAIGKSSGYSARRGDESMYAVNLFGKPPRTINCDCERSDEPALLQTIYMRNDPELLKLLDRPTGWLRQAAKSSASHESLVTDAYLRVLGRFPNESETTIAQKHLEAATNRTVGLRDLLWALLNTKEFLVNR